MGDEVVVGVAAVGDDGADKAERAAEKPREGLAGAHGGDDDGLRVGLLQPAGVTVGHPAHAEDDVGREPSSRREETGGEPIQMEIKRLKAAAIDGGGDGSGEGAAGAESQEGRGVAGGGKGVGEEDRLALGAAAAEVVLQEEDFHCPGRGREDSGANLMRVSFSQLLLRWGVIALGVVLAAKLVPGIRCDDAWTLIAVVLLLSFFNAILKPLLVLFTLPFILLSMGLGLIVINAFLLLLVGKLVDGFYVAGFGSAVWGSVIISVTNFLLSGLTKRATQPPPQRPLDEPPSGPPARKDDVIDI